MPLLDHFRPPLKNLRPWEGFHSYWASAIVEQLNKSLLPPEYFAAPHVKMGTEVEVDVATLEEQKALGGAQGNGGVATAVYAPPHPPLSFTVDFANLDLFEIQVREESGLKLVAAIELVSPGNKDRPAHRQAFVRKCATYLQEGIGVIIVDVVTERAGNFHADLIHLLDSTIEVQMDDLGEPYAAAYRMVAITEKSRLDSWPEPVAVGQPLPTLPLWLAADIAVPVNLEESYLATCESLRIHVS